MIRQSTVDLLREMHFSGMAAELERQLDDSDSFRELSFEDRLVMLVEAEWNRRQKNKYQRCLHIMDQNVHNAYQILVDGEMSMRERHGIKSNEIE